MTADPCVTVAGGQDCCPPDSRARLSLSFHSVFQAGVGDVVIPVASFVSPVESDSSLRSGAQWFSGGGSRGRSQGTLALDLTLVCLSWPSSHCVGEWFARPCCCPCLPSLVGTLT